MISYSSQLICGIFSREALDPVCSQCMVCLCMPQHPGLSSLRVDLAPEPHQECIWVSRFLSSRGRGVEQSEGSVIKDYLLTIGATTAPAGSGCCLFLPALLWSWATDYPVISWSVCLWSWYYESKYAYQPMLYQ